MKKILFILPIIALSICSITYSENECPPEKNYVKSNPEAMEKYKEEFKNGEIKSLYYDASLLENQTCVLSSCIYFDHIAHDFLEFKYSDNIMRGVYTSYWAESRSDTRCKHISRIKKLPDNIGCFYIIKNKDEKIKSKYGIFSKTKNDVTITTFYNIFDNTILYETASTIYPNHYYRCPVNSNNNNNNPNYKFDIYGFPYEPLKIFDKNIN